MAVVRQLIISLGNQVALTSTVSRSTCTIGRLPDNDLVLPDALVSPHHAEIRLESDRPILTDLESETGTMVNGVRVLPLQPHALTDGSAIQIGPYEILYRSQTVEPLDGVEFPLEIPTDVIEPVASPAKGTDGPPVKFALQRPTASGSKPNGYRATGRYLPYLPIIFHNSDFLARFLQIFETMWEPLEQRQDHIGMYFSPRTCPASWLPWFAGWFGLALDPHLPEARARALLAEAIEIYRWRGTKYGLARVIEVCAGVRPEITESSSDPYVFNVAVRVPKDAAPGLEETLEELVAAHKPAHAGYVIEVHR